jgi:hypothetical protein
MSDGQLIPPVTLSPGEFAQGRSQEEGIASAVYRLFAAQFPDDKIGHLFALRNFPKRDIFSSRFEHAQVLLIRDVKFPGHRFNSRLRSRDNTATKIVLRKFPIQPARATANYSLVAEVLMLADGGKKKATSRL